MLVSNPLRRGYLLVTLVSEKGNPRALELLVKEQNISAN